MALDFITLYVVILIVSIVMAIVWAVVYVSYERLEAAGIWMAACITTALGGCALATEGHFNSLISIFVGNGIVIFGFSLFWVGVRRFQGRPLPWWPCIWLTIASLALLAVFTFWDPNYNARNAIYAVAQSVPLALSIVDLLRQERRRAGALLAAAAMGTGIFVHGIETTGNVLQVAGTISRDTYLVIEPGVLVLVIFSGLLWNFGLVLMVIDRLNAELAELALRDPLTGLANRRAFIERLDDELRFSEATQRPCGLLVVDLDKFKQINDVHGHLAGDACLVHVATTATLALPPGGLLARTGGDEFAVLLPGQDLEAAAGIASALVVAMRAARLRWGTTELALTLSVGAAAWRPGWSGDALNADADAALYRAKALGRDGHAVARDRRVVSPDGPTPRPNVARPGYEIQ